MRTQQDPLAVKVVKELGDTSLMSFTVPHNLTSSWSCFQRQKSMQRLSDMDKASLGGTELSTGIFFDLLTHKWCWWQLQVDRVAVIQSKG